MFNYLSVLVNARSDAVNLLGGNGAIICRATLAFLLLQIAHSLSHSKILPMQK